MRAFTGRTIRALALIAVACLAAPGAASGQGAQEIRIEWRAHPAAGGAEVVPQGEQAVDALSVIERRPLAGAIPRERAPQLSPSHLVIAALDGAGREVFRHMIPDPRLLRAEVPDAADPDTLRPRRLHHTTVHFSVPIPNDPSIVELVLYQPSWTGSAFSLRPIGRIALP